MYYIVIFGFYFVNNKSILRMENPNIDLLDLKTPTIDNVLKNFKMRLQQTRLSNDNDDSIKSLMNNNNDDDNNNDNNNESINIFTKSTESTILRNESLQISQASSKTTTTSSSSSSLSTTLSLSKQARIINNDDTNNKLLKKLLKRYNNMNKIFKKETNDNEIIKLKDIAKKYIQLANNNDIDSIIDMIDSDNAVCYNNIGIEKIELGMRAFHHSLRKPYWQINELNIINIEQLLKLDNYKSSHIYMKDNLHHIEVKFTRYWQSIDEDNNDINIANATEIISINSNYKIVSIMYSQLPVKVTNFNNKYPDDMSNNITPTTIISNENNEDNINEYYEYFTEEYTPYYYNILNGESTWDQPSEDRNNLVYNQYQDENGAWYFYCKKNGKSIWVSE